MKVIDVKNQVRLSMMKCVELVLSGVRFRLFRAAITVVITAPNWAAARRQSPLSW